jgi:hypothetical protein
MAIPTLPGVKRRRGVGNEVAAFAQAFSQTWARLDRENRRGAGRDTGPYSDKAIEEQDPRLSKGIFGGLFGKGEGENLTPYERGVLRQQAIYDLAVKRGDVEAIERARTNMAKLNQMYDKGLIVEPGKTFTPTGYDNTGGTSPQVGVSQQQEQQDTALPVSENDPLYQYGGVGNEAVYTPDYQAFSRGGPVGMPSALPQMSALALDDEEPEVETQEQPTAYSLPEDPEELGAQAAEAVDAGYRTLAKRLEPTAAMPDEDEGYQASIAAYARGENRMTDEEVAAIDQAVDPEGALPRAQRTAARMAAIYRYYKDQGDEETANDVAARLVEYNEFAGQTRARLGAQAIQQGKVQEGVKLLTDAYEDNVPDGKSVKANVNPDGSVTVAIGYERKGPEGRISLAPELERTIPLSELPQVAGYFTEQGKRLIMDVGAKANQKAAAGAGASPAGTRQAVATYDRAVQALRALPADATDEQREAAYQAALGAYRNAVDSFQVGKGKSKAYAAQQYGVQPPQRMGAAAATAAKGTAEERAAAATAEEKARLDKRAADVAEDVDYRGAIRESEQDELARRKQADVDMRRIAMGAKNNPAETLKPKERKELYDGISVAADAALSERFNLPDAEKKDDKKVTLTKEQRAAIVDTAFDLARRNDLSEDQAVRAATSMLRGSLRPDADGMVQAGQFKVAIDPQYIRALAGMRVGLQREMERAGKPTASSSTAGELAARAARAVAGAVQNIPNIGAGYTSPELASQPSEAEPIRLMRDITPKERPQQEAVALQSELRFLQNKVARRSGSTQEIRAAQERIDELERAIETRVRRALPE